MDAQGHQLAHTHPDGWVSGVYYVRIPSQVDDEDPEHAGWIEFGRPLRELIGDAEPDTRLICPSEGQIVLFPSYVYHRTLLFDSTDIASASRSTPFRTSIPKGRWPRRSRRICVASTMTRWS